jgi:hypothetical protein
VRQLPGIACAHVEHDLLDPGQPGEASHQRRESRAYSLRRGELRAAHVYDSTGEATKRATTGAGNAWATGSTWIAAGAARTCEAARTAARRAGSDQAASRRGTG